jgi:hypothetical protein
LNSINREYSPPKNLSGHTKLPPFAAVQLESFHGFSGEETTAYIFLSSQRRKFRAA